MLLLLALTSVLMVIAVSALVAPVPPDDAPDGSAPSPAAVPASTPRSVRTELEPAPGEPFVLSADATDQVVTLPAGSAARIQVHAREPVSVQLGEDGPVELAAPGTPAEFPVFGDAGAQDPIRLLESGREIGRIKLAAEG